MGANNEGANVEVLITIVVQQRENELHGNANCIVNLAVKTASQERVSANSDK